MMHEWGDGFDFDLLLEAGVYISKNIATFSSYRLIWKEKYGSIRYERLFYRHADNKLKFLRKYQLAWAKLVFRFFVYRAIKKYPDMRDEILCDAVMWDCFTKKEKEEYWTRVTTFEEE